MQWYSFWTCLVKKWILCARYIRFMFFLKLLLYQFPGHALFFEFLVSIINHYHFNGLLLFWDSFEGFYLQISSEAKYLFLFCPRHWDQGLIVVIVYYFQIWNIKEHNIIIGRVINSHKGLVYIETHYMCKPDLALARAMSTKISLQNLGCYSPNQLVFNCSSCFFSCFRVNRFK